MKTILLRALSFLIVTIPVSCNEAKFRGGASQSAPITPPATFSCSIAPNSVEVGKAMTPAIKVEGSYQGTLHQKVLLGKETLSEATLIYAEETFSLESGDKNQISSNDPGKITLELRKAAGGEIVASCEAEITEAKCEDHEELMGARVAFVIDNSYSHKQTDCTEIDNRLLSRGELVCGAATNRETAVLSAFDVLTDMASAYENREQSNSHIAIASFPTKQEPIDGKAIHTQGWLKSTQENRTGVETSLGFTRRPFGYTPYLAGIEAGTELFAEELPGAEEKPRVMVLVTDGEPTDRNPGASLEAATKLKKSGVKLITVYVTSGKTRDQRRADHITFLENENNYWQRNYNQDWYDMNEYQSFADYIDALMGPAESEPRLIEQISDEKIEVTDAKQLKSVFQSIVKKETICK